MKHILHIIFVLLVFPGATYAASPWPAGSAVYESESLDEINPTLEPSGMVWHSGLEVFVVVGDEGDICTTESDGSNPNCITPARYDLEGVTYADPANTLIYLADEISYRSSTDYNITIREFDLGSSSYTGKNWDLSSYMPGASNLGVEALTFVPNGSHPYDNSASGGVFYAGSQYDGKIYVFDVDLQVSGSVSFLGSFTVHSGYTDLADLYYSADSNTVYAVFDANDRLVELDATASEINRYELPGTDQEAFTILAMSCEDGTATAFVGQDSGSIYSYANFPITCASETVVSVDEDGDGYDVSVDCNDTTSNINPGMPETCDGKDNNCNGSADEDLTLLTYYLDSDTDGYGSTTSLSSCTAVSGYVSNSDDCNDNSATVHSNITYYRDADADGLGDPTVTTTICSSTAPSGYVSNSTDTNDNGTTSTVSRIEYYGNGIDDDGDRNIDETNTISENGYDSTYSSTNPASTSKYKSYVTSISGTINGAILVRYADNAIYQYTIFSVTSSNTTSVSSWRSTGYLVVYHPTRRQYAIINAYTGTVYYTVNY